MLTLVNFLIVGSDYTFGLLGLPIFSSYHIVTDYLANTITFQPGCGCESSLDEYPTVLIDNKPISNNSRSFSGHNSKSKTQTSITRSTGIPSSSNGINLSRNLLGLCLAVILL